MKLTNFTDYSLRTLIYLAAHSDTLCTAREISESFDISYNHIVKVVHSLSKQGYIETRKGKGGGIFLAKPANEISIGEAVRTFEPDLDIVECFNTSANTCRITSACKLKHVLRDAYGAFIHELEKYSLADITANRNELLAILTPKK